jgi:uncharacterized protein
MPSRALFGSPVNDSTPLPRQRDFASRLALWLVRHRARVLTVAAIFGVFALWRTVLTYAALKSDLEELLPAKAPSVLALDVLKKRLPSVRYMGVVVDTGDKQNVPAANRFLDDLAARIRKYPKDLVGTVRTGVEQERKFGETYALQLMEPRDVRRLRKSVEDLRDWEVRHAEGTELLSAEEDPKPKLPIEELKKKYEAKLGNSKTLPNDRFVSDDGKTDLLLLQATTHSTGIKADEDLLARIDHDVHALGFPDRYAPGMRVGYSSDVPTRVEEMKGLESDLSISGVMVILLVITAIVVFFRSWSAILILGVPLIWGTVYAFGLVALPPLDIRELNSNTAFLGSIIVGNGVNSGIITLARFQEEREQGALLEPAIATALSTTWRPTLAASGAAAAAYGSLIFTAFRGFNRFGWIGGIGMLVCWGATMLLQPAMLGVFGHRIKARRSRQPAASRFRRVLEGLLAHPRIVIAVTAVAVIAAVAGLARRASGSWIEYDLSKLRRRDSGVSGAAYWDKRMNATLGRYLDPAVIMPDNAAQARVIEQRVKELAKSGGAGGLVETVRSADDLLLPNRAQSLAEAKKLKADLTPRLLSDLSPEDRKMVDRAVSPAAMHLLTANELPAALAAGLREYDGRIDRNVLVFPKLSSATWNAERLTEFTHDLRLAATVDGHALPVASALLLTSDIAAAMKVDGPHATALSLIAVLVICMVAFRALGLSLSAVSSLLVGVLLMLGTLAWSGEKLNFSNFVALPITFGIAADYSINMLKRYQSEDRFDLRAALSHTGGAVALCSATTIIGYGSLLLAQNRALFSFGALAVTGELTCLLTGIVALPSALALFGRRARGTTLRPPASSDAPELPALNSPKPPTAEAMPADSDPESAPSTDG